jgi:hypothetical protein
MTLTRRVSITVSEDWIKELVDKGEIVIDNLNRVQGFGIFLERLRRQQGGKVGCTA